MNFGCSRNAQTGHFYTPHFHNEPKFATWLDCSTSFLRSSASANAHFPSALSKNETQNRSVLTCLQQSKTAKISNFTSHYISTLYILFTTALIKPALLLMPIFYSFQGSQEAFFEFSSDLILIFYHRFSSSKIDFYIIKHTLSVTKSHFSQFLGLFERQKGKILKFSRLARIRFRRTGHRLQIKIAIIFLLYN